MSVAIHGRQLGKELTANARPVETFDQIRAKRDIEIGRTAENEC